MATYTDDFNRADSSDLGANWAPASGYGEWTIVSNAANCVGDGLDRVEVYDAGTFANDQYSQATVGTISGGSGGSGIGVCVRASTSVASMYWVVVGSGGSSNISVAKIVSGSWTELTTMSQAFSAGDVLRLEVTGSGASTVLKVFRNGVQVGSNVSDAAGSVASGKAGVAYSSSIGGAETLDDWGGGDLGAGGTNATVDMTGVLAAATAAVVAPPKPRPANPFAEVNVRM